MRISSLLRCLNRRWQNERNNTQSFTYVVIQFKIKIKTIWKLVVYDIYLEPILDFSIIYTVCTDISIFFLYHIFIIRTDINIIVSKIQMKSDIPFVTVFICIFCSKLTRRKRKKKKKREFNVLTNNPRELFPFCWFSGKITVSHRPLVSCNLPSLFSTFLYFKWKFNMPNINSSFATNDNGI